MTDLEKAMLEIAKLAIEEEFVGRPLIDKEYYISRFPELARPGAVFVTLNKVRGGEEILRGCIGSILPTRPLIDDIIYNAKAAAFSDPRFPPLQPHELDNLEIEISILSIPVKVEYTDKEDLRRKIIPGKHGVILKLDGRQATFLPQVWEKLPDFDMFFEHLCQKAGLPGNCLDYHPEIYVYTVKEIKGLWKE
ncbi:MAG: AmmeMemoRadiSam system protein A [Chlorobi bacterium]|nr:AmmeMemoRadiSam system protein A [Chlorobiota bacterium]